MMRIVREERGSIAPTAILLMSLMLGFCALVLDVGVIYAQRRSLQNAADAAALAGVRELERDLLGGNGSPTLAAEELAGLNGVPAAYGDCTGADGTIVRNQTGTLPHSWQVETSRRVPLIFGRVLGRANQCVQARATAVVVELKTIKIWPFGVLVDEPRPYGDPIVLKTGAPGEAGNFGLVDFDCGGGGAPDYRYWAFNGYGTRPGESVPFRIPPNVWTICTETGNKTSENRDLAAWINQQQAAGCPYAEPDIRCPLIGLVPIVREQRWPNGQKQIPVVDLEVFELSGVTVNGGNGQTRIMGRFLRLAGGVGPTYPPDPDGNLAGIIGVRLWE